MKILAAFLVLFLLQNKAIAQIEFCTGDKGTPVLFETFGTLAAPVDKNLVGKTSYKYYNNKIPKEGGYTISNKFDWLPYWFSTKDHTKKDKEGNALIVNVSEDQTAAFFERKILGLCSGTTYEFSAWILNLSTSVKSPCTSETSILGGLPVNVLFEIWDETGTEILKTAGTGQVFSTSSPKWNKYGLTFQTVPGQENVILKIANHFEGGCGNDLAIDDIQFVSCGDRTTITKDNSAFEPINFCGVGPTGYEIVSNSDKSIFKKQFYRWQQSSDSINFASIGNNTNKLVVPDSLPAGKHYFRVKVAESLGGLDNEYCNSISESFIINVNEYPEQPKVENRKDFCAGEQVFISVKEPKLNTKIYWYDNAQGGKMLSESHEYSPGVLQPGTHIFYAEAKFKKTDCTTATRTPVTVFVHELLPKLKDDIEFIKCKSTEIVLDSEVDNVIYEWSTGEKTKSIKVKREGKYTVSINAENNDMCKTTRKFVVKNVKGPKVTNVINEKGNLTVVVDEPGAFEYSINGGETYRESPVFEDIKYGRYKFVVKRLDSCAVRGPVFNFVKLN